MNKPFMPEGSHLGRQLEHLSELISKQCALIYNENAITTPVKSTSTLLLIRHLGQASITDLAKQANSSHQLINQKISTLTKRCLVNHHLDPNDKRRKIYLLTSAGEEECLKLEELLPIIDKTYQDMYQDLGFDLQSLCLKTQEALETTPLSERLRKFSSKF